MTMDEAKEALEAVKYRLKLLDLIEERLQEMKLLAVLASDEAITHEERKGYNDKVQLLESEIRLLEADASEYTA